MITSYFRPILTNDMVQNKHVSRYNICKREGSNTGRSLFMPFELCQVDDRICVKTRI